jgi:hypothetical protein
MVWPAPVTHPGQGGPTRSWARNPAEATVFVRGEPAVRRHEVRGGSESAAAASSPAPRFQRAGFGCRDRAVRQFRHPRTFVGPEARDQIAAELMMMFIRPPLTNTAFIPIFECGMISSRNVRPDQSPILERTGHPLPTRLFSCPPARIPPGSVPRPGAAYRSSVLDDKAHDDRRHARGRNPRRGAGW